MKTQSNTRVTAVMQMQTEERAPMQDMKTFSFYSVSITRVNRAKQTQMKIQGKCVSLVRILGKDFVCVCVRRVPERCLNLHLYLLLYLRRTCEPGLTLALSTGFLTLMNH